MRYNFNSFYSDSIIKIKYLLPRIMYYRNQKKKRKKKKTKKKNKI